MERKSQVNSWVSKTRGYCWRTYFSTYKAEISAGVLHASGPSEGSWVRRHVGASEFAKSIRGFLKLNSNRYRL
jgi:hypothetical protein